MTTILEHPPLSNSDWAAIQETQSQIVATTEEKKANHRANVVRVGPILPHPNADKLEITHVGGYQVVIGKGTMKEGDLAVYIQPDSVVPQTEPFRFIWGPYISRPENCKDHVIITHGENQRCVKCFATLINGEASVPERRRRITVRKFRKEWSEGLLLALTDFQDLVAITATSFSDYVGQDVSDIIGVTHYIPECDRESTKANQVPLKDRPHRRYPKSLKGWLYFVLHHLGIQWGTQGLAMEVAFKYPIYDVDSLKHYPHFIMHGDPVVVSEKIHGSNARYVVVDDKFYAGSRTQWKAKGNNVWWNVAAAHPEIEEFCFQNPGKVLYGEVGPTQKAFRYGAEDDENWFFGFDVYDANTNTWTWPGNEGFPSGLCAPVLYVGPYSDELKGLADGDSIVPRARHIREGVVISKRDQRCKLKVVSNAFLEKDNA